MHPAPPRWHSAHAHIEFDTIVRRLEPWLRERAPANFGYASEVVAARLAQRIVELAFAPYNMQRAREQPEPGRAPDTGLRRCGGLVFDMRANSVGLPSRQVLLGIGEFLAHTGHALADVVRGAILRRERETRPGTVVTGVAAENVLFDGSDARFVAYCRGGAVRPLRKAHWLVVQALNSGGDTHSAPSLVTYARFPLQALAGKALRARHVARLFWDTTAMALRFVGLVARFPLMATLARDYAYLPLVRLLDRTGALEAVVITNTSYSVQPLWMRDCDGRHFRAHLVWYSQNVVPLVLSSDRLRSDLPHYRHTAVDESWVWTDEFAVYLRQLGLRAQQRVVGPILWYLPHAQEEAHKRIDDEAQIRIAIFDITPIPDETALRIGLVHNYYRLETMTSFLTGIRSAARDLERATGRRVRLLLKHKRAYGPNHDRRYIDFVAKLAAEGAVELIDHKASLYSLTMRVDLSVVIPYSSPAYVASAMGRPAIYFDPSNELLPTHLPAPGVTFAGGGEALLAEALAILGRSSSPAICAPRSNRCS